MTATGQMARRLATILATATDEQWQGGTYWYASVHHDASHLAACYRLPLETVAGVIAVISPRLAWDRNVAYANLLLATGDAPVLSGNKRKALDILAGRRTLDVLSGPKVRAFYACILSPAAADTVCVDRHAVDAAVGYVGTDQSRKRWTETATGHAAIVAAYRAAADRYGITPAQAQAIVWLVWRERKAAAA